jgi:hypothetical protein
MQMCNLLYCRKSEKKPKKIRTIVIVKYNKKLIL